MGTSVQHAGWFNVYKPFGVSSASVVHRLKRHFGFSKIGHGGTLDPYAEGLLPIAFGQATKTISYVMDARKTYEFTVQFGVQTTTNDREGSVIATSPVRPSHGSIMAILPTFVGTILQQPPAFSAMKVDGVRAYTLARRGISVSLPPRPVVVHSLALLSYTPDSATFLVTSGKGFYVRSLALDIAFALGSVGHVSRLLRLGVGRFTEKTSFSAELLYTVETDGYMPYAMPMEHVLDDILGFSIEADVARLIRFGQRVPVGSLLPLALEDQSLDSVVLYHEGCLVAIGAVIEGVFVSHRVFT